MAKSSGSLSPDPPVGSEESEGQETSEEEIEGSESESGPESEPPLTQNSEVSKKSTSAAVSKKSELKNSKVDSADSSSDDEESDSETDSDSPIKAPVSIVKPISSKPMNASPRAPSANSSRSKPNAFLTPSPAKPTASVGVKRPSSTSTSTARESKKSKKNSETEVEGSENKGVSNDDQKKLFQRLWSEDDEIVILQGMIDYRAKKEADPISDLNDFHEFIKKSIHIDVSKKQLQHKIRRLKKKYQNNISREKKGKNKVSSKPHEQIAYELSKKIWGPESNGFSPKSNGSTVKGNKTENSSAPGAKVEELEAPVKEDIKFGGEKGEEGIKASYIGLGDGSIGTWISENGLKMLKGEKREEMEEKWKKFRIKEVELYIEKMELNVECAKIVLEDMKSLGD